MNSAKKSLKHLIITLSTMWPTSVSRKNFQNIKPEKNRQIKELWFLWQLFSKFYKFTYLSTSPDRHAKRPRVRPNWASPDSAGTAGSGGFLWSCHCSQPSSFHITNILQEQEVHFRGTNFLWLISWFVISSFTFKQFLEGSDPHQGSKINDHDRGWPQRSTLRRRY